MHSQRLIEAVNEGALIITINHDVLIGEHYESQGLYDYPAREQGVL